MSSQRIGKYACLELERRYLLRHLPPDITPGSQCWRILDRYLSGTRLRLRCMEAGDGSRVIFKLGQKYRSSHQDATQTTITNLYLTEAEHRLLARLAADPLEKMRCPYEFDGHSYSIDIFAGRHQGLVLAETECETKSELDQISMPPFAVADVTDVMFFTGGALASMSKEAFEQELALHLQRPAQ